MNFVNAAVAALISDTEEAQRKHVLDVSQPFTHCECGFDSGRGPSTVLLPASWRDIPFGTSDTTFQGYTDLEFLYVASLCTSIMHFATDQAHCVAKQPPELTFIMNAGRTRGVTQHEGTMFVRHQMIAGGARLLLLRAFCLLDGAGYDTDLGAERLGKKILAYRESPPREARGVTINEAQNLRLIVTKALGTLKTPDANKALGEISADRLPYWTRGLYDQLEAWGVKLNSRSSAMPGLFKLSVLLRQHPFSMDSRARVAAALSRCEDPREALQTLSDPQKVSLALTAEYSDSPQKELAKAIGELTFPGIPGGGYAQREEHRRMTPKGWPHILGSGTRNKPYVTVSWGEVRVHDLPVLKTGSASLSFEQVQKLMMDETGALIPYDEGVERLTAALSEFPEGEEELDAAVAAAMAEDPEVLDDSFPSDFKAALEHAGLDTNRFWDAKASVESLDFMREGETDSFDVLEMTFRIGPDEYTTWSWGAKTSPVSIGSLDATHTLDHVAGFRVYESYSDYGKTCWLRSRGLIGDTDELHPSSGPEELSDDLHADFRAWCMEVIEADGPWHELNSYDGAGDILFHGNHVVALWQSN